MRANPRVTLLCYSPRRPLRYLEIRGEVVEMSEQGALEHLDLLTSKYRGTPRSTTSAMRSPSTLPIARCRLYSNPASVSCTGFERRGERTRMGTLAGARLTVSICWSVRSVGVLTTMGRDGQPHSSLVWVDYDGAYPRVNTTQERQKGRDMEHDPRVSLLVVDPENTTRFIEIRGDARVRRRAVATEHL